MYVFFFKTEENSSRPKRMLSKKTVETFRTIAKFLYNIYEKIFVLNRLSYSLFKLLLIEPRSKFYFTKCSIDCQFAVLNFTLHTTQMTQYFWGDIYRNVSFETIKVPPAQAVQENPTIFQILYCLLTNIKSTSRLCRNATIRIKIHSTTCIKISINTSISMYNFHNFRISW